MIEIIITILQLVIIHVILLPVSLITATPVILLLSFFEKETYIINLISNYSKILNWWRKWYI